MDNLTQIEQEISEIHDPIVVPGIEENPITTIGGLTQNARAVLAMSQDLDGVEILNDDGYHLYEQELSFVRTQRDLLEAERVRLTKPLLETKRNIDTMFKRPMEMLRQAEDILKKCLLKYREKSDQASREAEALRKEGIRKAQEEMNAALVAGDYAAAEQAQEAQEAAKRTYVPVSDLKPQHAEQKVWKFNVIDLEALVKAVAAGTAPIEYLEPNLRTIGSAVRGTQGNIQIPGVMVYSEKSLRVRKTKS